MALACKKKLHKQTRKPFHIRYKNEIRAYSLIAYPLFHWGIFFLFALCMAFYLSFTNWDLLSSPSFVGLENYIHVLLKDEVFHTALRNTLLWTAAMSTGPVVIGFITALMIHNLTKGTVFFRTILYWPALVSAVVGANIQKSIFSSSPFGLVNKVLALFGVDSVKWFDNPDIALFSLMLMPFFLGFCTNMLFFIAGLKQIPKGYYEAAMIDGASGFRILWKITLPLLKPIVFLNIILSIIGGFKVIGPMQLITDGGPMYSTTSIVLRIYTEGFRDYRMGYASAMAFVLFAIILLVTIIQLKIQGEQISYE